MNNLELALETLEDRILLSGNVISLGANLVVEGTAAGDTINVRQVGSNLRVLINDFDHGQFAMPTNTICLLYTSPSPRDATLSRMPSSA